MLEFNIEHQEPDRISGWAWSPANPSVRLCVELHLDGEKAATFLANQYRSDLRGAGKSDGACGFACALPAAPADGRLHRIELKVAGEDSAFYAVEFATGSAVESRLEFHVDQRGPDEISGWAWFPSDPGRRASIEILMDGRVVDVFQADKFRGDLRQAGKSDGACSFFREMPQVARDGRPHEIALRIEGQAEPFCRFDGPRRYATPRHVIDSLRPTRVCGSTWIEGGGPQAASDVEVRVNGAPVAACRSRGRFDLDWSLPAEVCRSSDCTIETFVNEELAATETFRCLVSLGREMCIVVGEFAPPEFYGAVALPARIEPKAQLSLTTGGMTLTADMSGRHDREFAFDLSGLDLVDGDHEVAIALGCAVPLRPTLRFIRIRGHLELAGRALEGWIVDLAAPAEPVSVELILDGQAAAVALANRPRDESSGFAFSFPIARPWFDGQTHAAQIRVLGTDTLLPSRPVMVMPGDDAEYFRYQIERDVDGTIRGWAFSMVDHRAPLGVRLSDSGNAVEEVHADLPVPALAAQRFVPVNCGFALHAPEDGSGLLEIAFTSRGRRVVTGVPKPTDAQGIHVGAEKAAAGGVCVAVPYARDPLAIEEARSLLAVAARVATDAVVTLAIIPQDFRLPVAGVRFLAWIGDIAGTPVADRLRDARLSLVRPAALPAITDGRQKAAYDFELWARPRDFSTIVASAQAGVLAYVADAKAQGLGFEKTRLVVSVGARAIEARILNDGLVDDVALLCDDALERRAIARADAVVFENRDAMLAFEEDGGSCSGELVASPRPVIFAEAKSGAANGRRSSGRAIAFVGPLQTSCGLITFCDTVDRLARQPFGLTERPLIAVIGPGDRVHGRDAVTYVRRRAQAWPFQVTVVSGTTFDCFVEAIAQLPRETVCFRWPKATGSLWCQLSRSAGLLQLALPDDAHWDNPADLAEVLMRWFSADPGSVARPTAAPADRWDELVRAPMVDRASNAVGGEPAPLISVCVSHHNRPTLLMQTLRSIQASDYPNLEIVVVDDGSDWPGVQQELDGIETWLGEAGGRLVRQRNRYLGATRNAAADHARGDYLLFMDDDNLAMSDMISTYMRVMKRTDADLVTSRMAIFESNASIAPEDGLPRIIGAPLGSDRSLGVLINCFGDANMLIRRTVFERLGRFVEDYGYALQDWELYARSSASGLVQETIAEPLLWYRVSAEGMLRARRDVSLDLHKPIRGHRGALPRDMFGLLQLVQGLSADDAPRPGLGLSNADMPQLLRQIGFGRVAIIMRTRDRPILLERAIRSVLAQTYGDWVLVIVNDGGDPEPVDRLVAKYQARLQGRFHVLHNRQSVGMQNASNIGITGSASEFLVIHDDDDSWEPSFIERCVAFLDAAPPSVGGVVTHVSLIVEEMSGDSAVARSREVMFRNEVVDLGTLSSENRFPPIAFLFRRACYEAVGPFDGTLTVLGDWEFNLRFAAKFDIGVIREPLASYHHRAKGTGGSYGNTVVDEDGRHRIERSQLIAARLRRDLALGRIGDGALLYLPDVIREWDRH